MKRILSAARSVALAFFAAALPALRARDVAAVDDILKLKAAGMSEETVVSFVQSQHRDYQLSAEDVVFLKDQGLPAAVIQAMLANGRTPAPPPAAEPSIPSPAGGPARPAGASPAPGATRYPGQSTPATIPTVWVPSPSPYVQSTPSGPEISYFYQELAPHGHWIRAEDGRWYWQPVAALRSAAWRPYWDNGRWLHSDQGWYWSSDYPWGWAAFHYGRWRLHPRHGWLWLPDRVWGPAWVVWRTGDDFAGWAPLPPGAAYDTASGAFVFGGARVAAEFDFGLTWAHFSFCPVRDLGGATLHARFRAPDEARRAWDRSAASTRYSASRSGGAEARIDIVNHGIAPERVAALRGRPLETVRIADMRTPAPGRRMERVDHRTRTVEVFRPR